MRRFVLAVILALAVACPAYALVPEWDSNNLMVDVEYSYAKKDVESVPVVGVDIGSFASVNAVEQISDLKVWRTLVNIGYQISPQLTPYIVAGNSWMNFDQNLVGSASIGSWSGSLPLLNREYRGAYGFTVGGGLKGELIEFKNGIGIDYDARWTTFNSSTNDTEANLIGLIPLDDKMKASLGEFNFDMAVSKFFDLTKKNEDGTVKKPLGVDGVKPFMGFRWTHSDLNVKNSVSVLGISIGTEQELQGNMLSALMGAEVKITKNFSASVGGVIGDETGVMLKGTVRF